MTMGKKTKDGFHLFSTFSQLGRVLRACLEPSDPLLSKQTQSKYRTLVEVPGEPELPLNSQSLGKGLLHLPSQLCLGR